MKIKNLYKFFDYFGVFVFTFLVADSVYYIYSGNVDWRILLRLLIGISGFLVDVYLVFFYNENNDKGD